MTSSSDGGQALVTVGVGGLGEKEVDASERVESTGVGTAIGETGLGPAGGRDKLAIGAGGGVIETEDAAGEGPVSVLPERAVEDREVFAGGVRAGSLLLVSHPPSATAEESSPSRRLRSTGEVKRSGSSVARRINPASKSENCTFV